jgi:hypothetical protein
MAGKDLLAATIWASGPSVLPNRDHLVPACGGFRRRLLRGARRRTVRGGVSRSGTTTSNIPRTLRSPIFPVSASAALTLLSTLNKTRLLFQVLQLPELAGHVERRAALAAIAVVVQEQYLSRHRLQRRHPHHTTRRRPQMQTRPGY